MNRDPHDSDKPLFQRDDAIGELLRRGNAELGKNSGQAEAQRRLEERLEKRSRRPWLVPAVAVAALATLALVYPTTSPKRAPKPAAASPLAAVLPAVRENQPVVTPLDVQSTLDQGQTRLPDGSAVQLAAATKASWKRTQRGIHVELASGEVHVMVGEQPAGQEFVVRAGTYRFVVLGTEASVRSTMYESHLEVFAGKVEVQKDDNTVAFVQAGEYWEGPNRTPGKSDRDRPQAPRQERRAEELAPENIAPPSEDCTALVKSQAFVPATACYERQAQKTGLSAELALIELARLRLSALGDAPGAVRALEEHVQRFPNGVLKNPAELAMVRALSAAGRHADALRALEPLIARGGPKHAELLQLRGELEVRAGSSR
jgi:tetratricopeptide (TPR) repeat protein